MSNNYDENKIDVLLVENNPLDRLVIDEILSDTKFRLHYSKRGCPVHEKNPLSDRNTDRLLFEELLESDELEEKYEIILLDLGLDRQSEDILTNPDYQKFLASPDNILDICNFKWDSNPDERAETPFLEETRKIKGLKFLMDRTRANFKRVVVVISHFVDTSNDKNIQSILTLVYDNMIGYYQGYEECFNACVKFKKSIEYLVINKVDLRHLPLLLKEAYDARINFLKEVVNIGDCMDLYAIRPGSSKGYTLIDVVGSELLFRVRPEKGPRLIVFADYSNAINFNLLGWKMIFGYSLEYFSPVCTTILQARKNANNKNIVIDLNIYERSLSISDTIDKLSEITKTNKCIMLCRLEVNKKEFLSLTKTINDLADPPEVTITLVYDKEIK